MAIDNFNQAELIVSFNADQMGTEDGRYFYDIGSVLFDGDLSQGGYPNITSNQDDIIVIRQFDPTRISDSDYVHSTDPITSSEAWETWVLPKTNSSGSETYELVGTKIKFQTEDAVVLGTTTSVWNWTRGLKNITLPYISTVASNGNGSTADPEFPGGDKIYVFRKTAVSIRQSSFTTGSRLTASTLNTAVDQVFRLAQENYAMLHNFNVLNPSVGKPNGVCELDKLGKIPAVRIGGNIINYVSTNTETTSDTTGHWNAEGFRVGNLSTNPLQDRDAATKGYVDGIVNYGSAPTQAQYGIIEVTATGGETDTANYTHEPPATNPSYTLPFTQASANVAGYIVDINGVMKKPTVDYTIGTNTISFSSYTSVVGDKISIRNLGTARSIATTGDDLLVTTPGTSLARKVGERFGDWINVKDYGAKGDATTTEGSGTNDSAAIQLALNKGGNILFPPGIYRVVGELYLKKNSNIDLGGSTIHWESTASADALFNLTKQGDKSNGPWASGGSVATGFDAESSVSTVTVSDSDHTANPLIVGQRVKVYVDGVYWTENSTGSNRSRLGEVNWVSKIDSSGGATTYTLSRPLMKDVYGSTGPSNNMTIWGTSSDAVDNVTISNGTLQNVPTVDVGSNYAFWSMNSNNIHLDNLVIKDWVSVVMQNYSLTNSTISNCQFINDTHSGSDTYGRVGITLRRGSSDNLVSGCYFSNFRLNAIWLLTYGDEYGIQNRNIIDNNIFVGVYERSSPWLDEVSAIRVFSATNTVISNNTFVGSEDSAILVHGGSVDIVNNTLDGCGLYGDGTIVEAGPDGLITWLNETNFVNHMVNISSNRILGGHAHSAINVKSGSEGGSGSGVEGGVTINDNVIRGVKTSNAMVEVQGTSWFALNKFINGVVVSGNLLKGSWKGLYLQHIKNGVVSNNTIILDDEDSSDSWIPSYGANVELGQSSYRVVIQGNVLRQGSSTSRIFYGILNQNATAIGPDDIIISNNNLTSSDTGVSTNYHKGVVFGSGINKNRILVSGNTFTGIDDLGIINNLDKQAKFGNVWNSSADIVTFDTGPCANTSMHKETFPAGANAAVTQQQPTNTRQVVFKLVFLPTEASTTPERAISFAQLQKLGLKAEDKILSASFNPYSSTEDTFDAVAAMYNIVLTGNVTTNDGTPIRLDQASLVFRLQRLDGATVAASGIISFIVTFLVVSNLYDVQTFS